MRDEVLEALERRRKRSTLQLFLQDPLGAIEQRRYILYFVSFGLAMAFAAFALWLRVSPLNIILFMVILAILPPAFYNLVATRRIKRVEAEFPTFLRDITLSIKAGLTLRGAVSIAARGQYGALTEPVKHIDYMMSWGVSFEEALLHFARHYPTPLIKRVVSTIIEASRIGAEVGNILENVATDAEETKVLQKKRSSETAPYIVVLYLGYFVFLAVIIILLVSLLPMMEQVAREMPAGGLPGAGGLGLAVSPKDIALYKMIFFHALVIQGFFAGLITGKIAEGTIVAGLKHSLIFVVVAILANLFLP